MDGFSNDLFEINSVGRMNKGRISKKDLLVSLFRFCHFKIKVKPGQFERHAYQLQSDGTGCVQYDRETSKGPGS